MTRSDFNWFAASGVERLEPLRKNKEWVEAQLNDAATRIAPVWRHRNLVFDDRPALLTPGELEPIAHHVTTYMLLGDVDGTIVFAADMDRDQEHVGEHLSTFGDLSDLREMAGRLQRPEAAWLAHARGLAFWHQTHQFCGVCGSATEVTDAGHVRTCTGAGCGKQHFPRTDPAVIVLIEHDDKCLLGRNRSWTNGLYSTLAGFVEPGESLEDAVRREIFEEAGVRVGAVHYHSSQPWPFPASVMLGFFGEALSDEIIVDEHEIADARWFSREEILNAAAFGPDVSGLRLPREISIARKLLDDWYGRGGESLDDEIARVYKQR
jgi:NAD+ diphosphatase